MHNDENSIYILFNGAGVLTALGLLGISIWIVDVDLATKGYWVMGLAMLMICLVNLVKYRFDQRKSEEIYAKLESAKNEKLLKEYAVSDDQI
ncbi:hypothetical protein [Maritalea porphyrae]|uniref:YiaAB two helix domain-containing protein n=1 Tax=Maritalea porphyrae TaxID=880732 RepID=A0ABQ5UM93_9HYPH|nr:hypothetical protein [Maritalea porphyrae]GLQ15782.1 hypothetical protein GCM10007879_00310 [Maritalea porphyrae]